MKITKKILFLFIALFIYQQIIFAEQDINNGKITAVKDLLKQLEQSIKTTALANDWKKSKKQWYTALLRAKTVQDLRKLVYQLELNLRYKSQSPDWRSFVRSDWLIKIKNITVIKDLVSLIVLFETSIYWNSHKKIWKQNRKSWILTANKISGDKHFAKKIEEQDENAIASVRKLSILIRELEKKINYEAQNKKWRENRKNWIEKIKSTNQLSILSEEIIKLHNNIKRKYFAKKWHISIKNQWIKQIKTQNIQKFAANLVMFERGLRWNAHYKTWWNQREAWIRAVNKISGSKKIHVKFDTSNPKAKSDLLRVSGFLIALEGNINQGHYSKTWNNRRVKWIRDLFNASNARKIKTGVIVLANNLKKSIFIKRWQSRFLNWKKNLQKKNKLKPIIKLIIELERAVAWDKHVPDWRKMRNIWYKALYKAGNLSGKYPKKMRVKILAMRRSRKRRTLQSITKFSEKDLKCLSSLLIELEQDIIYRSKSRYWRIIWMKNVIEAKSIKRLGYLAYRLESKIPYRSQIKSWRRYRRIWKSKVRNVRSAKMLASLVMECERAMKWNAHNEYWRKKREVWIKELNKVRKKSGIPPKNVDSEILSRGNDKKLINAVEILLDFENEIKTRFINDKWESQKIFWMKKVVNAKNFAVLSSLLSELNDKLKSNTKTNNWAHVNKQWKSNISSINNSTAFFYALIQLEQNINWETHSHLWKINRQVWYRKIFRHIDKSVIPDKRVNQNKSKVGRIQNLALILYNLEQNIKRNAFLPNWKNNRSKWLIQLFNVKTLQYLANRTVELSNYISSISTSPRWKKIKARWKKSTFSVKKISRLAALIRTLERAVKYKYQNSMWRSKRKKWFIKMNKFTGQKNIPGKI